MLEILKKKKITKWLKLKDSTSNRQPDLFHYKHENGIEKSRIHLRLDPDGHGTLIVNANQVMHLNPTAALMAHLVLEKKSESEIIKVVRKTYSVSKEQVLEDLQTFHSQLDNLIRPDGACAIHELDLEMNMPFSARPSAPYRMDLALTYRCNNDCAHCYNARERNFPEMSVIDWKRVLDITWDLGIPHIVFTGGEPTLVEALPELIAHAEANGQITGMNTNARRMADKKFLDKLVSAGLDHVQVTVESHDAGIHDQMMSAKGAHRQTIQGLKNALETPLYVMTNTTMLQDNVHTIPETLDFLADLGVPTIGLNALIYSGRGANVGTGLDEKELTPILEMAQSKTEIYGQRLIWYTPTQYCNFDPTKLNLGIKGCTAALYNMCVEPDGAVLPCQSYYTPVGNLLHDNWDSIWNHDLSVKLRERQGLPNKCGSCDLIAECGGGCPIQFEEENDFVKLELSI
ncbi:MAG: radical SAM protein [Anaerolineae bacterium]|jgi:radical SAM protein with 4Fe4S-binding SPASM domain|nr:radical SAM protein [Anaerolineae bacterium]MBT7075034.1 radical SAM protein [Anaerolineae bacterium]MBT7783900.1 radical SAM protein [Anaerolineae bacterium]